jgi:glycosyltransferase involved in cell wall biosynthesis
LILGLLCRITKTVGANEMDESWPVAVFAYNEGENIVRALDSLIAAADGHPIQAFVLANGCTDDTENQASQYAATHAHVQVVSIARGDKANAWNVFVHEVVSTSDPVFFMDGDVELLPGALPALAEALANAPHANAVTALPAAGRSRQRTWDSFVSGAPGLQGTLYALRGIFVRRLREMAVRMPVGYMCDDDLICSLALWDLDPSQGWDDNRVAVAWDERARFRFRPFSPLSPRDVYKHWRRVQRNSLRRYHAKMLGPLLKDNGLAAMPTDVHELYKHDNLCHLEWRGFGTLPDWLALRRIRGGKGRADVA